MLDSAPDGRQGQARMTTALNVLVVEDEAMIAMELEDMLGDLGHSVLGVATNVETALVMVGDLGPRLDVAVVDANLGGRSALPIIAALQGAGVAIVLTSGYARAELERLGFSEVTLGKPYCAEEVADALARHGRAA